MKDKVLILSQEVFEKTILHKIDDFKDAFFISILDPDEKSVLKENCNIFKTWKFYDMEHDIDSYKAITFEQAQEINKFIEDNFGKRLIVHCHAGVSRSSAIGEFYFELLGGSYKDLTDTYKHIMPNSRVLQYLRIVEKNKEKTEFDKIFT